MLADRLRRYARATSSPSTFPNRRIDVNLTDAQIKERLKDWKPPTPHYKSGVMAKYAQLVSSASRGAITDKL